MENSVGKKLQQARLSKQLSIEEAARVTRIRPDKLMDLEDDIYTNFPSMAYAKGFLVLYAKYLDVDVRDFADTLHAPNPVSSDDYEYLNAAASGPPPPSTRGSSYRSAPRRERSILPVIVFGVLAGAIILAIYLVVTFQRLGPSLDELADKKDLSSPAASPAISTLPPAPPPARAPRVPPPSIAAATPMPLPPAFRSAPPTTAAAAPLAAAPLPSAVPAGTFDPTREVRRAEPVFPVPSPHAAVSRDAPPSVGSSPDLSSVAPVASPGPLRRLSIRPLRKTWVTIRRDVADSPPFFQDWLYPGDPALKLSGHKFWIQVEDPASIEVTEDGQPLPAGQNDIKIE